MVVALVIISGASLGSGTAARASTSASTGTISTPSATAGTVQNLGVKRIAVNRLGGSLGAASVHCSTANDTAVAGKDYTAVSEVITWASGDATEKWCGVPISDATPFTGDKTFYVKLSNPTGAPLGTYATTKVTIYGNKGGGLVSLSAAAYTVAQNAGSVTISLIRTNGSAGAASVNYATANSTAIAGINYMSERGTLGWGNGDTAPKKIVVLISNAVPFTGTKTFAIAITGAETVDLGTTTSAIVTINGDAATSTSASTGTISTPSATASTVQNLGVKRIAVNRLGGSRGAASVHCSTANDTAVAGKDYTAVSEVITWASGDATEKWCGVPISDATPFTGDKTFYVKLSNPTGAPLGTYATTKVTIYGNKGAGLVSLSAATYTVAQNAGSVTITVNRTNGWAGAASVDYATANSTAIAGANYTSERGQLSWSNGDITPKKIVIPISRAAPFTGTKKFAIAIASAENVSLGATTSAIVTIDGGTAPTTGTATLSWTAPTYYTNGTPITDLAGYNLYYGTSSTTMTKVITINNPAAISYTISSLAPGTWYFAIRAYDAQAVESALSRIVSKTI